jgi:hypothetical protein
MATREGGRLKEGTSELLEALMLKEEIRNQKLESSFLTSAF